MYWGFSSGKPVGGIWRAPPFSIEVLVPYQSLASDLIGLLASIHLEASLYQAATALCLTATTAE